MNTTTIRALVTIAKRRPLRLPCCCMQPKFRFVSTLSTAATNLVEWESPIESAPMQPTQLHEPDSLVVAIAEVAELADMTPETLTMARVQSDPLQLKEKKEKDNVKNEVKEEENAKAKTRTHSGKKAGSKVAQAILPESLSGTSQMYKSSPVMSSSPLKPAPFTSQSYPTKSGKAHFPELEPAPFPKDIHSSMPYANREVQRRRPASNGVTSGTHNDLQSFEELNHNTNSTIYRGTLFEYQAQEILKKKLGIYTQRSAGNNDLGVDLRGTWFLPLSASPKPGDMVRHLKVIVQCKTMNAKIGPKYVRELQGTLSYESQPTMAILAVSSEFTERALLPYAKSKWPMALVVIDIKAHECRKLMWNRAAEKVMHGLQIGTGWSTGENGQFECRPVLFFEGKLIERLPGPYLNDYAPDAAQTSQPQATTPTNYAIPDCNVNMEPEYLYIVPEATGVLEPIDADQGEEDGSDHSPLHSRYLESLTWLPSTSTQEAVLVEE